MINRKGSISFLTIIICILMLINISTINTLFTEYKNYNNSIQKYDLFLIENKIIYDVFNNNIINLESKDYSYNVITSIKDVNIVTYFVNIQIYTDSYSYTITIDRPCNLIISFDKVSNNIKN